ncbi:hypothetical protein G7Y79_00067g095380 [Physcia stellaris]|nr:hypothetical protein G7Y79_00067g095380 [Physcia stellaris]
MGHPGALFMADPANSYGGDPADPYMVDPADLQFLPLYAQPSLQPSIEQFPVHSTIGGTDVQRNRSFQTEDVFLAQLDARLIRAGALLGAAGGTTSNGTAGTPTTLSPYQRLKVISSWLASNPGRLRLHINHLNKVATQADWRNKPFEDDTVELRGVVFLGQATDSDEKRFKAITKARAKIMLDIGEEAKGNNLGGNPSIAGDVTYMAHDEPVATPCDHCMAREVRRMVRKPKDKEQKKPPVSREWATETAHRILVFNAQAMHDWQPGSLNIPKPAVQPRKGGRKTSPPTEQDLEEKKPLPPVEEGTVAADLADHFFLCNNKGEIVGETMTEPILIADDHKSKTTPPIEPEPTVQQYLPQS